MEDTNKKNNESHKPRFNHDGRIHQADAIKLLSNIEYDDLLYHMHKVLHDVLGNNIPPKLHNMNQERQKFYETYLNTLPQKRQKIIKTVARIRALDAYHTSLLGSYPYFAFEETSPEDTKHMTLRTIILCPEFNATFNERNELCFELEQKSKR